MAFADIDFYNSLWLEAGLDYLLLPQDAPPGKGLLAQAEARKNKTPANSAPAPRTRPAPQFRGASQPINRRPAQNATFPERAAPHAGDAARPGSPREQWQPIETAQWPQILQRQLSVAKNGLIAWTYLKLGEDLLTPKGEGGEDTGRSARAAFLRRLIKDLAHPAGTHTFWPVSLPPGHASPANMDGIFWSAMAHLGCRGVIVMGSEAAKIIAPGERLRPLILVRPQGRFVWVLWEIDTLVATPEKYGQVLVFLRQALRAFVHN